MVFLLFLHLRAHHGDDLRDDQRVRVRGVMVLPLSTNKYNIYIHIQK
jgi:hypothetical protein